MGTPSPGLTDIRQGRPASRLRLLMPLRYLLISHPEKKKYDIAMPLIGASVAWLIYVLTKPSLPLFGDTGLLKAVRDLLGVAVPFLVGALAAVSMGFPGKHLDQRLPGVALVLDGKALNARQFVCFLLGYLCFLGITILGLIVVSQVLHTSVSYWVGTEAVSRQAVRSIGAALFFVLLSSFVFTTYWALYFLTDIVNRSTSVPNNDPPV